jgi:uncharacterized protein (TIGR00290 family)
MDDVAVAWSTGKDAALALWEVAADSDCRVVELFTTVSAATDAVRGHDVPRTLLSRQAVALGYPLRVVELPDAPDAYERHLGATFDAYDRRGIDRVVYAYVFVAPIREYRDSLLADHALDGYWPLWNLNTTDLVTDVLDAGFRATVVAVNGESLDASYVGRELNEHFLDDLPSMVDPCGENGEFHTFVWDGPVFETPVTVETTSTVTRVLGETEYHYADLSLS